MDFVLDILTADRTLVQGLKVQSVTAPGREGTFQVLPGHTTLLAELEPGVVSIQSAVGVQRLAISGGFAEVMPGRMLILADQAVRSEDINLAELKSQQQILTKRSAAIEDESPAADVQRQYLQAQASLN